MTFDRIAYTVSRYSNGDTDGVVSSVELDLTDAKSCMHVTGVLYPTEYTKRLVKNEK